MIHLVHVIVNQFGGYTARKGFSKMETVLVTFQDIIYCNLKTQNTMRNNAGLILLFVVFSFHINCLAIIASFAINCYWFTSYKIITFCFVV